jgi:hypothetical protein
MAAVVVTIVQERHLPWDRPALAALDFEGPDFGALGSEILLALI